MGRKEASYTRIEFIFTTDWWERAFNITDKIKVTDRNTFFFHETTQQGGEEQIN